jgi:hypothetical protein
MTAVAVVCGVLAAITAWQTAVVLTASLRWGTGVDYYRWGWRGWKARAARGLDTRTACCYVQFGWVPVVAYAGQSVNPTNRFRGEGQNIMALVFAWGLAIHCHPGDMNDMERFLIRLLPWCRWFGFNLTGGGS